MNSKRCVSLELAKELKEAGWTKPVEFYWCDVSGQWKEQKPHFQFYEKSTAEARQYNSKNKETQYPAPLSDEILEELPSCEIRKNKGGVIGEMYMVKSYPIDWITDKSLPNILARFWLLLKKEKLI